MKIAISTLITILFILGIISVIYDIFARDGLSDLIGDLIFDALIILD